MLCGQGNVQKRARSSLLPGDSSGTEHKKVWLQTRLFKAQLQARPVHRVPGQEQQPPHLTQLLFLPAVRRVPPRFSIPPTNHEVMPGGSVNLTCVAVGAPMPYVKWLSGELELTREEEMPIGRNVLELTNIRQSANYTCVAVSSLGVIETTAQICVKGQQIGQRL